MGEVVNLRRARKAKTRGGAEAEAAAKRVQFGRTKAEKTLTKAEQEAAARKLDGHEYGKRKHAERSKIEPEAGDE
jgi:Domain of unknown function (DUF4169)